MREIDGVLYRYFRKQDLPWLNELISSSVEAMPFLFHHVDFRTRYRILSIRYTFEKYLDRLRRFAISLSPAALLSSAYDRTTIVAVDRATTEVVGAIILSALAHVWSLDIIVVDRAFRQRGIGTRLVELAKQHARRRGARRLMTTTSSDSTSSRFFRDNGFQTRYRLEQMECHL